MLIPRTFALLALLTTPLACGGNGGPGDESGGTGDSETGEPLGDPEVFPGLSNTVEIVIDTRGIPHIYAATDRDLFYAAGYQMATDRLFQIDLMRRRAYGRGAEVLGESKVDEDKISRLFDFKRWGALDAARMLDEAPSDYALFSAWVAGVNARIDDVTSGAKPLPYGFDEAAYQPEKWDNVDPFVIAKMLMFGNSNTLEYEFLASAVRQLTPDAFAALQLVRPGMPTFAVPPEDRPAATGGGAPQPARPDATVSLQAAAQALPPDAAASLRRMHDALAAFRVHGSNNWAVDGRFTDNGKPLIANDPHQPLQSPNVMYAQHLNSADRSGSFDAAGFGFAGTPGVQLGHNRHVQWAATTGFADCMDLYSVAVDVAAGTINAGGTTAPITVRNESIKVKGAPAVELAVSDVDGYGVLLGDALPFPEALVVTGGRHVLINWTGFRATNETAAFLGMARATNVREWEDAVEKMEVGTFNWLGADKDGISYHLSTLIPDRGDPSARPMPYTVVDGDEAAYYWNGKYLSDDKLPRSHAEQTGFIVTANNDPLGFTADGDLHNDPWYYGAFYDPGYRGARIESQLQSMTGKGKVSAADMQALQTDTYSVLGDQLLPVLAEVYARVPGDDALASFRDREELATLVKLLTVDWDRTMQQDQAGALAFHAFAHNLATAVFADDLLLVFPTILEASPVSALKFTALAVTGEYPDGDKLMAEGRDVLVMTALSDTAAWLTAEFGAVNPSMYSWGERHGTAFHNAFGGELEGAWVPTHGGEDTVNVSSSKFYTPGGTDEVQARFESNDGAVFRVVTRFQDDGTPEAFVNFPRGNSGEPDSAHFSDTLEDWRNGVYTKYPYSRAEVDAALETRLTLEP